MALDNTVNVEITASVEGLKSGLKQAESGVKNFSNSTDQMVTKTNKMAGAVKVNAVPAMTSFSQVIQDAPYGIRGVANNITQLTMQMGYLTKSSGGVQGAMKSMVGTLMGPAGILLAVSLVTSLMVSYGDELANIGSKSADLAKKNEELAKSFGETKTVLDAELGTLDAQLSILTLQGQSTKILLDQKLALLTTSLSTLENQKAALQNQIKNTIVVAKELSLWEKISSLALKSRGFSGLKGVIDKDEASKIKELEVELANVKTTAFKTIEAIGKIKSPEIFDPKKGGGEKIKEFKGKIVKELSTFKSDIDPLMGTIATSFNDIIPLDGMLANLPKIDFAFQEYLTQLKEFNAAAESIIRNGVYNTFADLGSAIGTAIGEGTSVLRAVGASMLDALGGILVQFGELAIAYGVANLALYKAITSGPNPVSAGVAIAAGVALVAIGSAISSFSKGALSGGGSSTDYSSSSSGSSKSYGSSSTYSSGSSGGGTYVFEIQGTKLIGVLKNTLDRNKALGGSNNLIFST